MAGSSIDRGLFPLVNRLANPLVRGVLRAPGLHRLASGIREEELAGTARAVEADNGSVRVEVDVAAG